MGLVVGGTFTGDGFYNGGSIVGGTFSGNGFNHDALSGNITGGTFIYPAANVSTSGENTLLSVTGFGPVFGYPTPQSGGGNGLNLAQLIGLPNFIKI